MGDQIRACVCISCGGLAPPSQGVINSGLGHNRGISVQEERFTNPLMKLFSGGLQMQHKHTADGCIKQHFGVLMLYEWFATKLRFVFVFRKCVHPKGWPKKAPKL